MELRATDHHAIFASLDDARVSIRIVPLEVNAAATFSATAFPGFPTISSDEHLESYCSCM